MKIKFNFDMNDWMEFQKYFLFHSRQFKKTLILATVTMPTISILIIYYKYSLTNKLDFLIITVFSIFSLLWIFFYPKRFKNRSLKRIEALLNEGDNRSILGIHEIEFDENSITHIDPASKSIFSWKGIVKYVKSNDYYYLFNTSVSAIIIPIKKTNLNEIELNDLEQMFLNKIMK